MSYGKVHDVYWDDGNRISGVSDRAALLALFLMTGRHRNAIGCFRLGIGAITDEPRFQKWGIEGVSKALQELSEVGFMVRDDATGWTFITKALDLDPIKGGLAAVHAAKLAASVPDNSIVYQVLKEKLEPLLELEKKALGKAIGWPMREASYTPSQGVSKAIRSPSPSPQPEPKPEPVGAHTAPPAASPSPNAPPESVSRETEPPSLLPAEQSFDDPLKSDDEISDAAPPAIVTKRGTRLPADWQPSVEDIGFCEIHRPDLSPGAVADTFRDYWISAAGQKGVKLDWAATWRNWVRGQRAPARPVGQSRTMAALEHIERSYSDDDATRTSRH